ncbi:hypothetical protein Tco_1516667 [Tanacetum coccineum]
MFRRSSTFGIHFYLASIPVWGVFKFYHPLFLSSSPRRPYTENWSSISDTYMPRFHLPFFIILLTEVFQFGGLIMGSGLAEVEAQWVSGVFLGGLVVNVETVMGGNLFALGPSIGVNVEKLMVPQMAPLIMQIWTRSGFDGDRKALRVQGLPRHIFNNLNQTSTAKEIWDNVEMLMQGSGRTIQQRKEDLKFPHPTTKPTPTSSNSRTHATVHDGQIVTEPIQRKAPGPNAAVAFMANLSSTSATNNPVNENFEAETEIDDNTIARLISIFLTNRKPKMFQLRYLSADTSDKISMIAILTDLQTQLDGHAKVNQEKCLEIETLKNELLQCKQEICRLDTHKVKLDLENKVRQEQALVIQRNKRNAELVQENDLLKSTLSGKEKSIAFLQSEKEKILSDQMDPSG